LCTSALILFPIEVDPVKDNKCILGSCTIEFPMVDPSP
jgi:hypothetical protein